MRLTKYEQETIINFNAGEKTASVYTADKSVMAKFDELVNSYPDTYKLIEVTEYSKTYEMPKSHISYRKPRHISEETRQWRQKHMKRVRTEM